MSEANKLIEQVIIGYCDKIKETDYAPAQECIIAVDIIAKLANAAAELKKS